MDWEFKSAVIDDVVGALEASAPNSNGTDVAELAEMLGYQKAIRRVLEFGQELLLRELHDGVQKNAGKN